MSKGTMVFFALIIGLSLVGGCVASVGIGTYNSLVFQGEAVTAQWSQVENVYQRRFDLIPNVVETVKGYAAHERETLTAVVEARAKVSQIKIDANQLAQGDFGAYFQKFQEAQSGLSGALSRLMVVVEKYPDLKASGLFQDLMVQLEGTENRIANERRLYNESAREYNTTKKRFPTNLVAGFFDFEDKPYFKAEEGSEKAPKVNFGGEK